MDDVSPRSRRPLRQAAEYIVRQLRDAGHSAFFAGGCVRDLLLGRQPKDYDIATDATPDRVSGLFRRTEKVGAKFGVVIVRKWGHMVEVATFRSDGDYHDGRHPSTVSFSDLEHDAQRRDFTINGMFFDPLEDKLVDLVGGAEDLHRRVIRAIGDPGQRFAEDHLRMLRAVRFAARLSFDIDPGTMRAIRAVAHRLQSISAERVRAELAAILTEPTRMRGWELIHASGLSGWLVQDTAWTDAEAKLAASRLDALPDDCGEALAWAALLGKYAPDDASVRCRALTCSNSVTRDTAWLLEQLPRILACDRFETADFKLLMADPRIDDLVALMDADIRAGALNDEPARLWRQSTGQIPPDQVAPDPLVNGDDLATLGLKAGPAFARILTELYRRQLNGALTTRPAALQAASELVACNSDDP